MLTNEQGRNTAYVQTRISSFVRKLDQVELYDKKPGSSSVMGDQGSHHGSSQRSISVGKALSREEAFTVALIGGDGAGKTSIARSLEESFPLPNKYLYMGLGTLSSNHALPTTRLARYLRLRAYKNAVSKSGTDVPEVVSSRDLHYRSVKRGPIWEMARFLNRLAEAWYRQLLSLSYQLRGYIVVYDRHFAFDVIPTSINSEPQKQKPLARIEYCLLNDLYPKPDLVLYLDAPANVLYERKGEATIDYLQVRTRVLLEQGKKMANFVRIDAAQPLDTVFADVTQHILSFYEARTLNNRGGG
jgi:thymidylate kinase